MQEFSTFIQVVLVDLLFAGDNAIAIGLVASSLPKEQRKKVILIGVGLAVLFRIAFAVTTVQLLKIPGLLLIGGLLLVWIAWRLYADMQLDHHASALKTAADNAPVTFKQALYRILIADISMSLDNVLAVAAIAREHLLILVFGLALSIVLMLIGANYIASILDRYRWLGYLGIAIIAIVAAVMIWDGGMEIYQFLI